jgi:hypothetical protein
VEDFGAGGGWVVSCCGLVWMLDWIGLIGVAFTYLRP